MKRFACVELMDSFLGHGDALNLDLAHFSGTGFSVMNSGMD
jgi:hypothetical protein